MRKSVESAGTACALLLGLAMHCSAAEPCEALRAFEAPGVRIEGAQLVPAGTFAGPAGEGTAESSAAFASLPAFCRVAARLTPAPHSQIGIEVWLPAAGWNGKLLAVGNGGWGGRISYVALAEALAAGYAAASTDTGHRGRDATFALEHPDKLIDFAHRAVHEMTVAAKALVAAHYGRAARRAYFSGCSTGGRQALAEAQRYPGDYDGIVAGAPANYITHLQGAQLWTALAGHDADGGFIPPEKYPAFHAAVLRACDARDGVPEGVLENPPACDFDPQTLACAGSDAPGCLTPAQVRFARAMYAGPRDERAGTSIYPGLARGSELGWPARTGPQPPALAVDTYRYLVFRDPTWDYRSFDVVRDVAVADRVLAGLMNATDPDLRPFVSRGGKLLMYHGWSDPGVTPLNTVRYYGSVVAQLGAARAGSSVRLFMVPGMGHCRGGEGTDEFDAVAALDAWVETGRAPESIVAARRRDGRVERTRPLCPYPRIARYAGRGSTDDAASFSCAQP